MKTIIYGASDDLIEIDGEVYGEVENYSVTKKWTSFLCSDGTKGKIKFNGNWEITINNFGWLFDQVIFDGEIRSFHNHELCIKYNVPTYSYCLILNDGIEWVKIGNKKFKA